MRQDNMFLLEKYKKVLKKNFFFRDMCNECFEEILNTYNWNVKNYEKGEINFDENIFHKDLNVVLSGGIKISKVLDNGTEILYDVVASERCYGLASLYTNMKMEALQAEAMEKSLVFSIDAIEFQRLIRNNSILFNKFMEFQEYRLHFFVSRFENSYINNPYDKLIYYFNFLKKWNIYEITAKKTQLALYLNIGRASLYRELIKMKKEKLINIIENKIILKKP